MLSIGIWRVGKNVFLYFSFYNYTFIYYYKMNLATTEPCLIQPSTKDKQTVVGPMILWPRNKTHILLIDIGYKATNNVFRRGDMKKKCIIIIIIVFSSIKFHLAFMKLKLYRSISRNFQPSCIQITKSFSRLLNKDNLTLLITKLMGAT